MALKDLDREYRSISNGTREERIEYCENLIKKMRARLTDDYTDTSQIRTLMLEMIESAQNEIENLTAEDKNQSQSQ
jgi:hypothetical protein